MNIAVEKGFYLCFVLLCRNKANVNIAHDSNGFTPLRMAVSRPDIKMVEFLLQNTNVDLTIPDFGDILPVQAAKSLYESNKTEISEKIYRLLANKMVILLNLNFLFIYFFACIIYLFRNKLVW